MEKEAWKEIAEKVNTVIRSGEVKKKWKCMPSESKRS
jgi:hypothetical protein